MRDGPIPDRSSRQPDGACGGHDPAAQAPGLRCGHRRALSTSRDWARACVSALSLVTAESRASDDRSGVALLKKHIAKQTLCGPLERPRQRPGGVHPGLAHRAQAERGRRCHRAGIHG
ncbi:MAG: hypothetical protein MZW92_43850 [Comamonadaceae bacterium]|nr:hypothetical protein [Comamonadaceae bacterium]